jgi:hypothetical protein
MDLAGIPIDVSVITPAMVRTRIFEDASITTTPSGTAALSRERLDATLGSVGMDPAEAARLIFRELAAGTFWISTHPEGTAAHATARADYLTALKRPEVSAEMHMAFQSPGASQ